MSVKLRRELERRIVRLAIHDLLAAGFRLSPSSERGYDVEEMLLGSTDPKAIMERAFEADECHLFVVECDGPVTVPRSEADPSPVVVSCGWVYLVYGNDGWDVISDYTGNLEPHLKRALALADKYA